jgi:AcrR family transcriptional regulator
MTGAVKYARGEDAKAQVRAAILEAALRLGGRDGWDHVTIRKISAEVGYAAPILYKFFDGKDDLLRALVEAGFDEISSALEAAVDAVPAHAPPTEAIRAVGHAYWRFAFARAPLYLLMHQLPGIPFGTAATPAAARRAFGVLRNAVAAAHPAQRTDDELDAAADQVWAALHGLVSLTLQSRIKGGQRRARTLLDPLLDRFVAPSPQAGASGGGQVAVAAATRARPGSA